jgi:hypothetical protein
MKIKLLFDKNLSFSLSKLNNHRAAKNQIPVIMSLAFRNKINGYFK